MIRSWFTRKRLAWVMLIFSVVNWPLSIFTYASDEQPVILSLSWFAIIWTSVDILFTAQVKEG